MFHVVKGLCDHEVEPTTIAKLLDWRSSSLFFEIDGIWSAEEFVNRANGKLGPNRKVFDQGSWFCGDGELIFQNGKTYAFTNRWGNQWKKALRILQEKFPEANIEFSESHQDT